MPKTATPRSGSKIGALRRAIDELATSAQAYNPNLDLSSLGNDLSYPVAGFLSNWAARDPETGEIVDPLTHNLKRIWNSDARRKAGLPPQPKALPGIINDTLSIPNMFGTGPEWSKRADQEIGGLRTGILRSMNLNDPVGFKENLLHGAGIMAGQLPVPASEAKEAEMLAKGFWPMVKHYSKKAVTSPIEFISPTVVPSWENYMSGALFAGGMGALDENAENIAEAGNSLIQDAWDFSRPYDTRLFSQSTPHPSPEKRDAWRRTQLLKQLSQTERKFDPERQSLDPVDEEDGYAEGGKASGALKTFNRVMDAAHSKFPQPGMFSVLDNLIQEAPFERGTAEQWRNYLKPGREHVREGVKFPLRSDELKWSGPYFQDVLAGKMDELNKSYQKDEMLKALRDSRPQFNSHTFGDYRAATQRELREGALDQFIKENPGKLTSNVITPDYFIYSSTEPKFGHPNWRSPGGQNYHEWVTTLPSEVHYEQPHFDPTAISWSRVQDLIDPEGVSHLEGAAHYPPVYRLIDELQSDLHQAATWKGPKDEKRLGYYNPLEDDGKSYEDLLDENLNWMKAEAKAYANQQVNNPTEHWPQRMMTAYEPDDARLRLYQSRLRELQDKLRPPYGGQPPMAPFSQEGWIRHELHKNLLAAVDENRAGLAVVDPEVVGNRYTDNPGLKDFYANKVHPELEKLAARYGANVSQMGSEALRSQYHDLRMGYDRASEALMDIREEIAKHPEEDIPFWQLKEHARKALQIINDSGYDPDLMPRHAMALLNDIDRGMTDFDIHSKFRSALRSLGNRFDFEANQLYDNAYAPKHKVMELTPELKDKIRRIGVPLFSSAAGALSLFGPKEDEPVQTFAEGGKASTLREVLKVLSLDPEATARLKAKAPEDPVALIKRATDAGVQRGVVHPDEATQIHQNLATGDERAIIDSLLNLHEKLFPSGGIRETHPVQNMQIPVASGNVTPPRPPGLTPEAWDEMIKKQSQRPSMALKRLKNPESQGPLYLTPDGRLMTILSNGKQVLIGEPGSYTLDNLAEKGYQLKGEE